MANIRTIVVPSDGSEHSTRAAAHAATLASALNVPVHLFHASPEHPHELFGIPGPSPEMVGVGRIDEQTFRAIWDKAAEEAFRICRQALGDTPLTVETVRGKGDPSQAIIDYAGKVDAPMIVIGRRGLGRFRGALLGSVSQRVLQAAKCPVLVVS